MDSLQLEADQKILIERLTASCRPRLRWTALAHRIVSHLFPHRLESPSPRSCCVVLDRECLLFELEAELKIRFIPSSSVVSHPRLRRAVVEMPRSVHMACCADSSGMAALRERRKLRLAQGLVLHRKDTGT
jgi:hypothetical protein